MATGGFSSPRYKAMTHGSPRWPKFDEFPLRQVPFPTFFGVSKKQSNLHGRRTVQARPNNPQEISGFVLNATLRKFVHLLFRIRYLCSSLIRHRHHHSTGNHTNQTFDTRHTMLDIRHDLTRHTRHTTHNTTYATRRDKAQHTTQHTRYSTVQHTARHRTQTTA